ncbi:hypothetical protein AVEN_217569-1 [Araneus ventricosus]|uniref:Uncharacterized protein n=1 Tax=Araneus ventricosus TaxID=182803 RepID=A0A4Y2KXQ7_ARAVE|nr:hypothetical protein AVEN_217569-1 [Araneus ventricosus]
MQGLFWDGLRNFAPRSDEGRTLELAPLEASGPHQHQDVMGLSPPIPFGPKPFGWAGSARVNIIIKIMPRKRTLEGVGHRSIKLATNQTPEQSQQRPEKLSESIL